MRDLPPRPLFPLRLAIFTIFAILRVRDGGVDEITTPQIPVGMFEDYTFASAPLTCQRGDLLALLTDGLIEVFDAGDRELGLDAIKALVGLVGDAAAARDRGRDCREGRAHARQLDDQTLLLIRRT